LETTSEKAEASVERVVALVIALAFGWPASIKPNQQIGQIASKKAREMNAPVYTQLDVEIEDGVQVYRVTETPGQPPSTLRMAREIAKWAKDRRVAVIWLVAAKPHLWRARRDLEEALAEVKWEIGVQICQEIFEYPDDSWFSPESAQARTRLEKTWKWRELILRAMPFSVYEIVDKLAAR